MSSNYRFYSSMTSLPELAAYFSDVLGVTPVKTGAYSPSDSDEWWVAVTGFGSGDHPAMARRLGVERYSSVVFEPRKNISWETETHGLTAILTAVVSLLGRDGGTAGLFEFYDEILVLEKRPNGPVTVDPRLLDADDLDDLGTFEPALRGVKVQQITQQ